MFESLRGLIIGILCYYSINNEVYFFYNFRPNSSSEITVGFTLLRGRSFNS